MADNSYLDIVTLDQGPVYRETNYDQWIVEPWNTASAAFFLLIVGYWAWKLRGQYRKRWFLTICVVILLIGAVGGTIYHAFRESKFMMRMDYIPIIVLCMGAAAYFWVRILRNVAFIFFILPPLFVFQYLSYEYAPNGYRTTFSYAIMGVYILIPLLIYLKRTHWAHARFFLFALGLFATALVSRMIDKWSVAIALLPMGTHFLWHTFGALACHSLFAYVYRTYYFSAVDPIPEPEPRRRTKFLKEMRERRRLRGGRTQAAGE